jgi:hypothetical protein
VLRKRRPDWEHHYLWKTRYFASTNHKIWAAKFTARHPNLVAMEISNFKCGHVAPIYGVIEGIIEKSHTPYFSFKDLDENKPIGSVKIRVETIDYFLRRYREDIIKRVQAERQVESRIAEYERCSSNLSELASFCASRLKLPWRARGRRGFTFSKLVRSRGFVPTAVLRMTNT